MSDLPAIWLHGTRPDFAEIYSRRIFGEWRGDAIYPKAMKFLDEAKVYIASGAGGDGCISSSVGPMGATAATAVTSWWRP
jgi:hypothetical protein